MNHNSRTANLYEPTSINASTEGFDHDLSDGKHLKPFVKPST